MDVQPFENSVWVKLNDADILYVKPSLLKGFRDYNWTVPPPHPFGSPIVRLYYRTYLMKEVAARALTTMEVQIIGEHSRGQFRVLRLNDGEKYCVGIRYLAAFSGDLKSIHTKIQISPAYWLLHEHFFSVFEGPGIVLLYTPSSFEDSERMDFQPERIAAFAAGKKFKPVSPRPTRLLSQLINLLFSHEIIWHFQEAGQVIAETTTQPEPLKKEGFLSHFLKHVLGFLRL